MKTDYSPQTDAEPAKIGVRLDWRGGLPFLEIELAPGSVAREQLEAVIQMIVTSIWPPIAPLSGYAVRAPSNDNGGKGGDDA